VVVGMVDDGLDPQAALDRPRFCLEPATSGGTAALEAGLPQALVEDLQALGHPLRAGVGGFEHSLFGRGQIIRREPDGVLWGGSDPRADGCALGF
jgi:gamma-glutamyltranspeptidase/glutathione hydrolase